MATPAPPSPGSKSPGSHSILQDRLYITLLELAPDPIVVYDLQGGALYLNGAFTETFGWRLEELSGKRIDFVPPENLDQTCAAVKRMMTGENLRLFETRRRTKSGQVLDIQLSTSQLLEGDASWVGNIVILRDVTEQKSAEKKLQGAYHDLENRVRSRTAELLHANRLLEDEIQERRRVESNILNSEQRLAQIIEVLPDPTFVIDKEGRVLYWNRAIEELTGCKAQNMVGKGDYEYALPFYGQRRKLLIDLINDPDPPVERKYLHFRSLDNKLVAENYHPNLNSKNVYLSGVACPLFNSEGQVVGAIESLRDITHSKENEETLRQQKSYQLALNATVLGMVRRLDLKDLLEAIVVKAAELTRVRDAFLYLVVEDGRQLEMKVATGRLSRDLWGSRMQPGEGLSGKVWQSGKHLLVEDYAIWEGRSTKPEFNHLHSALGVPLKIGSQVSGVLGVGAFDRDLRFGSNEISVLSQFADLAAIAIYNARLYSELQKELGERRVAEAALMESEARYRTLIEKAGDAILLLAAEGAEMGTILEANQAAADMHGYRLEELPGMHIGQLDAPESAAEILERMRQLNQDCWIEAETVHQRKDGSVFPVEIRAGLVEVGQKKVILAFDHDISSRKRSERDKHLLELQLQQAQRMEAIGTLAGGIAHDFNNILSAIIGYTEITLYNMPIGSQTHQNLQNVLKAGDRAKSLVTQILTFSRQSDEELKPVQVCTVLEEALKLIRATLPATIEIQPQIQSESITLADPTQLHQIVMNLCSNSAHAMDARGGRLEIVLRDIELSSDFLDGYPHAEAGRFIRLTVADNGYGIPEEIRERIFDPFFTTKGEGEGTGMGLSVVHGIVTRMGGVVTVDSAEDRGTTFQIFLPIIEGETDTAVPDTGPLPTGHERILMVEDEEFQADIGKQILVRLGYDVTVRTDSLAALDLFADNPTAFDLVITDMTMPHMTGYDMCLKLLELRPEQPVIICTGYSAHINAEKVRAIGAKGLLMKPISAREMAQTVRRALEES